MSEQDPKPVDEVKKPDEEFVVTELQELQMYKDYLRHIPVEEIAVKYSMTPRNVWKIAQKHKWKAKRKAAKELAYKNLDKIYKRQIVDIVEFLQRDFALIMARCRKEKREMTKEERKHVLDLFEKTAKEAKLTDGVPTEINASTGVVKHVVELPPGVEVWGVIPPAANVTMVNAEPKKAEEVKVPEIEEDEDYE